MFLDRVEHILHIEIIAFKKGKPFHLIYTEEKKTLFKASTMYPSIYSAYQVYFQFVIHSGSPGV